jgi:hypothetical protein
MVGVRGAKRGDGAGANGISGGRGLVGGAIAGGSPVEAAEIHASIAGDSAFTARGNSRVSFLPRGCTATTAFEAGQVRLVRIMRKRSWSGSIDCPSIHFEVIRILPTTSISAHGRQMPAAVV